jgi:hypothetical protein
MVGTFNPLRFKVEHMTPLKYDIPVKLPPQAIDGCFKLTWTVVLGTYITV